jgi:hypothetical protein
MDLMDRPWLDLQELLEEGPGQLSLSQMAEEAERKLRRENTHKRLDELFPKCERCHSHHRV